MNMNVKYAEIKKDCKEIPYQVKHGVICITPCTLMDYENRPLVGSVKCQKCTFFRARDKEKHVVLCAYNVFVASRKHKKVKEKIEKPVIVCVNDGKEYSSISKASEAYGISRKTISKSIKENIVVRNYKFDYV